MKEFLLTNFKEIIILACFLVEMIVLSVAIVKKSKKGSSLYSDILSSLPEIVSRVEKTIGAGHGAEKLRLVLDIVSNLVLKETGEKMTQADSKFFTSMVEKILDTPEKKKGL